MKSWLLAILPAAMIFSAACTDRNDSGIGLLPDEDLLQPGFTDTISLSMRTLLKDSIQTGNLSQTMIGQYVDPEMGRINVEAGIQFNVTGNGLLFGDTNLTMDSIVLQLDLEEVYGRYDEALDIEVYEILDPTFSSDSSYSSIDYLAFDSTLELSNGFHLDFSSKNGFVDELKIRLDSSFGNKILFADSDSLSSGTKFREFMNGLYIRVKQVNSNIREPGAVYYIDLFLDKTVLTLHYHEDTARREYDFIIDNDAARFAKVERSEYQNRLLGSVVADSMNLNPIYGIVQAGAAVKLFVDPPFLHTMEPRAVNKAELVLKVDQSFLGSQNRFDPPEQLFIFNADSSGKKEENPLNFLSVANYNAGTNSYTFALTINTSQIIAGQRPNNGLIIVTGASGVTMNRAIFGGPGHPTLSPKYRVIFTPLPN